MKNRSYFHGICLRRNLQNKFDEDKHSICRVYFSVYYSNVEHSLAYIVR